MDVQTDIVMLYMCRWNKPDDLADCAFKIIAGHAGKSVWVNFLSLVSP